MGTFNKTVTNNDRLFFQRGEVTTTNKWFRPSYTSLKIFLNDLKDKSTILNDYEVYIMGGVLFDFQTTWDVDMCLIGGNHTDEKIESDLNFITDLGHNTHNLLIDVTWYESRPTNLTYEKMVEDDFHPDNIIHKKIGYVKKQINDEIEEKDLRTYDDVTLLTEHLIQRNYSIHKHTDKMIQKVQNNPNPITITTFSVNEFLETDENHFLNNTNR
jgi:hypothetical protein